MRSEVIQSERTEGNGATPAIAEASRFCLRLIGGVVSVALVWVIFSWLIVPSIIESAYRGESLPFLNSIISGQAVHPVQFYLASWEMFSWRVFGMLLIMGLIPLPLVTTRPDVQRYFEARYGNVQVLKPLTTHTILALIGFALPFYLYYLQPVGYVYFITEDHWAEYGSFVAWGMATCFFAWTFLNDRKNCKPGLVLLALAALFLAMEEISWGQRVLGLTTPHLFVEYNFQNETSLHNLVLFDSKEYMYAGIATFLWAIVLPISTRKWGGLRVWCRKIGVPIVSMHLWPFFLLAIFHLIWFPFSRSDEWGELFLGIAIAALSLDLVLAARRGSGSRGAASIVATAGVIVTLGILTGFLVQSYSWPELLSHKLNWYAGKRFPKLGMYRQAEMLFDWITKNPHFVTPETRLWHGTLLMQMGQHAEAKDTLELALADQRRFEIEWPGSSEPYRVAGEALTLLGRKQEAEAAFLRAIKKDQTRLKGAKDPQTEAILRWSLGKTFLASGDPKAASEQVSMARALQSDRETQSSIEEWIRENLEPVEIR